MNVNATLTITPQDNPLFTIASVSIPAQIITENGKRYVVIEGVEGPVRIDLDSMVMPEGGGG